MERFGTVFSPIQIEGLSLRNRLVMSPMHMGYATDDGAMTSRLMDHYLTRAKGGVGLIIQEATSVRPEGRGLPRWLGIWNDSFVSGFKELVDAVHSCGPKIAIQLHYAGRTTTREVAGCQPGAPSEFTCQIFPAKPRVLTIPEIVAIEDAFAEAAGRALVAGYDAIELHGAHGYLFNQFMSPLTNQRRDNYGGDLSGRLLFSCNVLTKIRRVVGPRFPVSFRLSADEYMPGGLTLPDTQLIVPRLIEAGAGIIHVSAASRTASPAISSAPMGLPRGNLIHLAAGVKKVSTVPVIAVGHIVDLDMAEETLRSGKADLVAMGRALLADPELPNKAKQGRLDDIRPCIGCHQGCRQWPASCMVNPEVGRDREWTIVPAPRSRRVVVVGGGPAGLEAARVAALRGHRVTLFEQEASVGGRLRAGAVAPGKQDLAGLIGYLEGQVRKLGVELRIGESADIDTVNALHPDAVVVATGGQPIVPDLPGADLPHVVVAEDVLLRGAPVGQTIVVMGAGMTGCEVAEFLAARGKGVTIVTRIASTAAIAQDVPAGPRALLMGKLGELGVEILKDTTLEGIEVGSAIIRHGSERTSLPADSIVLAQGYRPNNALASKLSGRGIAWFVIGDAADSRTAKEAILEGAEVGRQIA